MNRPTFGQVLAGAVVLWSGALLLNRQSRRVTGGSMAPTLRRGDLVLVRPPTNVRPGQVVVARDPRDGREVVKRVSEITADGVWLVGDAPDASTDSRTYGAVPVEAIDGVVVARWWPPYRR